MSLLLSLLLESGDLSPTTNESKSVYTWRDPRSLPSFGVWCSIIDCCKGIMGCKPGRRCCCLSSLNKRQRLVLVFDWACSVSNLFGNKLTSGVFWFFSCVILCVADGYQFIVVDTFLDLRTFKSLLLFPSLAPLFETSIADPWRLQLWILASLPRPESSQVV